MTEVDESAEKETESRPFRLVCAKCSSFNVVITSRFIGRGTGPEGRCRMGDPSEEILRCDDCKHIARR